MMMIIQPFITIIQLCVPQNIIRTYLFILWEATLGSFLQINKMLPEACRSKAKIMQFHQLQSPSAKKLRIENSHKWSYIYLKWKCVGPIFCLGILRGNSMLKRQNLLLMGKTKPNHNLYYTSSAGGTISIYLFTYLYCVINMPGDL